MKNTKNISKKSSQSNATQLVSKNFYISLTVRIAGASAMAGIDPAEVMNRVDHYITDGSVPEPARMAEKKLPDSAGCVNLSREMAVMLIFKLMQPEIDKAVARSKAARLRALDRKRKTEAESAKSDAEPIKSETWSTQSEVETAQIEAETSAKVPSEIIEDNNNESKPVHSKPHGSKHSVLRKIKFRKKNRPGRR